MTDGRFYTQVLLKEVKVKTGVGLGPPGYTELQEYKESLGEPSFCAFIHRIAFKEVS